MVKNAIDASKSDLMNNRKILVISSNGFFSDSLNSHCVHLAERLGCDLVGLSVDTRLEGSGFETKTFESAKVMQQAARQRGIRWEHIVRTGDLESSIEEIMREIKRVELAMVDTDTDDEEIRDITVPVISVVSSSSRKGGRAMGVRAGSFRLKAVAQTAGYGALSAACFAAVFTNSDSVMQLFTRGGWYAALPIATVLAFSLVHGAFAHNLWSLLGVEALKKDRVRQTERKVMEKKKQLRKRPRLYAYVNPFHRIDR